ncbi:hypothetical protein D8Y22_04365 [Salinadaptatus halalkaliphilus]|uniref:KaiC-like domain-containing protein n=1 Tax=Salinadaptatus halalkaliphilus TaxID=2419781 RepID=A0A4S3TU37_9EURY|nr:hypothetical protein [Salinadaptatus halalkaliphilus]THE66158.1 hypothetical protein D8Y22_04365 [Salinadaptatus halalkaliphilus]
MDRELGAGGAERVAHTLDTLKRTGSNILLVGPPTQNVHTMACHRLCGDQSSGSRYHLFVTDDPDAIPAGHGSLETTRTIEYPGSATADTASTQRDDQSTLESLGLEISEAIDDFDTASDGLEPSQLRLCVGSLATLLQDHDTEAVFRLVHVLTSRIDHVDGMGHYHLPVSRDHDAVALLEPLFDATVELRTRDETYEQRWELRGEDVQTDWVQF